MSAGLTNDQFASLMQQQFGGQAQTAAPPQAFVTDRGGNQYQEYFGPASGPIQNGMISFSRNMPATPGEGFYAAGGGWGGREEDRPKPDANAPKGRWQYMGPDLEQFGIRSGDQNGNSVANQGAWQWVADQAPAAMPAPTEEPVKQPQATAPSDGRTIYNDWDYFQQQARAAVEGINRMPFTYADYPGVATDKNAAMNQFYPGAWQKDGLQPFIGPNGQNISNQVGMDVYGALRDGKASTADAKDWPSLLQNLQAKGLLNSGNAQSLLDLANQKKLDTSFASSSLMGMMG